MGRLREGITGPFSGKVSNVVGIVSRGRNYVRARPRASIKTPTKAVVNQRNKLAFASHFLNSLDEIFAMGFKMGNTFINSYQAAMQNFMLNAITGSAPEFGVNFSKFALSNGRHYGADSLKVVAQLSGCLLNVSWDVAELNESEQIEFAYDQLHIVCYNTQHRIFMTYPKCAYRILGSVIIKIPPVYINSVLHAWFFFTTENGKISSPTKYLGEVVPL